tara:strand:+ start:490 stop:1176 length:687 start_codon:yes stop_codon:yes gene_type:complete
MAKYARGKKSYAISDRGGQRVRYTQLKTTWDGLRVAPDEWEPKHPQLTPAKNIIDAQQLFQPRSTGQDREDVVIYLAHTFDPFIPVQERPPIGCPGHGFTGSIDRIDFEAYPEVSGVAGTGAVGTETPEMSINEAGVAGTGGVGVEVPVVEVTGVSGGGGAGNVGVEALNLSILESGVAGTGAVGTEVPEVNILEAGVAGTGGVGNATGVVVDQEWGSGAWNAGTWGN